jgi:hypothetical protein
MQDKSSPLFFSFPSLIFPPLLLLSILHSRFISFLLPFFAGIEAIDGDQLQRVRSRGVYRQDLDDGGGVVNFWFAAIKYKKKPNIAYSRYSKT